MSTTGLSAFDTMTDKAIVWLDEIARDMGTDDRQKAYQAMRSVLHMLRDRLPLDEAVHLSAELPTLIRGIYFDHYVPQDTPTQQRTTDEFLASVREHLEDEQVTDIDAERATKSVFKVISGHLATGQVEQVVHLFAKDMRDLWPDSFTESVRQSES